MSKSDRPQAAKVRNEGWRDARLRHANMNLTVPAKRGKGAGKYKRPAPGSERY